jgi:hypothetical protein
LAGARRVQSAYPRFRTAGTPSTIDMTGIGSYDPKMTERIASLPEVRQSRTFVAFQTYQLIHGAPNFARDPEGTGTFDGLFYDQDRFTPTSGRLPDRHRVTEVAVNRFAAQRYGYRLGQHLDLGLYSQDQISRADFYARPPPPALHIRVRIVGVGLFPEEVIQDDEDRETRVLFTPALTRRARALATYADQGLALRHGDADIAPLTEEVSAFEPLSGIEFRMTSVDEFHALQAVRPLSIALALFGGIASVAGLVLVTQALTRLIRIESSERSLLRPWGRRPAA